jgi:hypothetical protein
MGNWLKSAKSRLEKLEDRNSKLEGSSKFEFQTGRKRPPAKRAATIAKPALLDVLTLGFQTFFEFRSSNFEFAAASRRR